MATFPGSVGATRADVFAPLPGRSNGLGIPFSQADTPVLTPLQNNVAGPVTPAGGKPGTKTIATFDGFSGQDQVGTVDWFEKVHVLPKTEIEFGNIISTEEEDYQLHNAFRGTDVVEQAIINNADPGVELPNNVPPELIPKNSTLLDPTSTGQTQISLGTLVALKVQALPEGLPTFDTNIVFDFALPGNDVQLFVSGTRIVLLPYRFESPFRESLAFSTKIIPARSGREQRIANRTPRQGLRPLYELEGDERRSMQAFLFDWMDNIFGVPLFEEEVFAAADIPASSTTFPTEGALDVDFRIGGLGALVLDQYVFDTFTVDAITDTLITAADPIANAYPEGTSIVPVRACRLIEPVGGLRRVVNLEGFELDFEVTDNDTGKIQGDTTPGFWSIYNGRVLFDDCNVVEGDMRESFVRRTFVIDNETGITGQTSLWDRNKRAHSKGFVLRNRPEILEWRRLMMALNGKQKAFYIPTFADDLRVIAPLASGGATMNIQSINYTRFVQQRAPMDLFRITFTDGTFLIREVNSSNTVSGTEEQLILNDIWPANRAVDEIQRIEFYELVRFDTDRFELEYEHGSIARVTAPVLRVFDDN